MGQEMTLHEQPQDAAVPALKTILAWSSGKDSAYALEVLRLRPDVEVVGLLTTLNRSSGRVSMHGVRESVLEAQANACGLPLVKVFLPDPCTDEAYRDVMTSCLAQARDQGVEAMAFGDLFLPWVRKYREEQLAPTGILPLFPLWESDTAQLAREMIDSGLQAVITCVDTHQLDESFVGRRYDHRLLADLPAFVDPCGERGEFHTCVVGGNMWSEGLRTCVGEVVVREGFAFADVLLV